MFNGFGTYGFCTKLIKSVLSVNVVIMEIILFCIYSLLRSFIEMKDRDAQYKLIAGVVISGIGIGVTALLIHMIGGWVIIALPIAMLFIFACRELFAK